MAIARGLSALALLLGAASIAAASPCEEARSETGLAVVPRAGALVIAAVDAGSAAAQAGLREGDALAQVNATVPRTCADFARAVREARKERKALLVLVQRGDAAVPLAVAASTWKEPAGTTVATAAEHRTPAAPPAPPPPPPPLPPEVPVSLDGVVAGLKALTPADEPSTTLSAYRADLTRAAREIETLAARNAAPPETVERLRGVAHTVEAAAIAWDAMEALRERDHRPRRIPIPEAAAAPYFEDSPAASVLDEFAFLRPTVAREPSSGRLGMGESSGLWRPVAARALLWDRGRADLARVTAAPRAGTP